MTVSFKPSKNHDDSKYYLNFSIIPTRDLDTAFVDVIGLIRPCLSKQENYKKVVYITLDVCDILRRMNFNDIFIRYMRDLYLLYGKLPKACPLKKGVSI